MRVPNIRTYVYIDDKGKFVHSNCGYGYIGQEYEHDDPNWTPPEDWPYEIVDMRNKKKH